jgi:hypothetical protein
MAGVKRAHGPVKQPMNRKARQFLEELLRMRNWRQEKLEEAREDGRLAAWAGTEFAALSWATSQLSALEEAWLSDDADESLTERVDQIDRYIVRAKVLRNRLVDRMRDEEIGEAEDERGNDE